MFRGLTVMLVICGLMIPLMISGCAGQQASVVAVVNEREITYEELEVYINIRRITNPAQDFDEAERSELLDEMITDLLLYHEAVERGFEPDKETIDREYEQYRNVIKGHLLEHSEIRYQARLQELNLSEELVLEWVGRFNAAQQLMKNVAERAILPTADEVEAFYEHHKEQFVIGERRRLRHILISEESLGEGEDIESLAQEIYQKLAAGEDFAELAARYSADSYSKDNGGAIGWFEYEEMTSELAEVVFNLELGVVSQPTETDNGLHLIEVLEIKEPDYRPIEEVFEGIFEHLYQLEQKQRTTEFISRLHRRAEIEIR